MNKIRYLFSGLPEWFSGKENSLEMQEMQET